MSQGPNILILITDEQKANAVRLYGHPVVSTPTLEGLAQTRVLFRWGFTPHPLCLPARVCFWQKVMRSTWSWRAGGYQPLCGKTSLEIPMPSTADVINCCAARISGVPISFRPAIVSVIPCDAASIVSSTGWIRSETASKCPEAV